jgi:hypothetical protein
MNCEQMQTLFSPYLDKMTTPTENEAIAEHLGECVHCTQQMQEMGRMCALLKNLDSPQIPADFGEKLHERISHEKIQLFPVSRPATPKRTGWVAATVAGLAISAGIFASSYLPYGAMVASLQNWINKDDRPHVAIVDNNKILQDWINKQLEKEPGNGEQITDPAGQTGDKAPGAVKPGDSIGIAPSVSKPVEVAWQEKVEQNYTAKIQVDNMDKSMHHVVQLAYASGAQISVKSANVMAADDSVKVVTLQVPKDKADRLLSELGGVGVEAPLQNNVTYTQTYNENQKTLAYLQIDIDQLQNKASLSDEQQSQLQSLLKQKQDLQAQQEHIDREVGLVTIEVRLVEKTNP